jgi:hypothetical protein
MTVWQSLNRSAIIGTNRQVGFRLLLASTARIQIAYFFCSFLSASFSAVSSASAAFTFTSGSTPVPSQSYFEMGLIGLAKGTKIMK